MKGSGKSSSRGMPLLVAGAAAGFFCYALSRHLRRMDFGGKSVVISGGSRGLGLELARQFAGEGAKVTLLARSVDELERARIQLLAAGADVLTLPCDVRKQQEVEEAIAAVLELRGRIDVLVNNAGIIQVGPFENMDLKDYQDSLEIHALGALHLIRAAVPHMQTRRRGRIVNISSIGGLVAVPHQLPYTMGKFALTGLSDGIRAELAKDGILVTTVAPGLMRTGSHVNATFKGQHRKEYAWFAISGANPLLSVSVRRAAAKIIQACRYGDARLIISLPARLLHLANSLFPGLTAFGSGIAGRLLPAPAKREENTLHTGWESRPSAALSILTRPSDREIVRNNETG